MFRSSLAGVLLALIPFAAIADAAPAKHNTGQHPRYFRPKQAAAAVPRQQTDVTVVNAASFLPGISPGGLATIFGQNLSTVNGVISANRNPLPTELGGVAVLVNGVSAGIVSVAYANGEDQINFQVPWETDTGPGAAEIEVLNYGNPVVSFFADSFVEDPGIFVYNGFAVAVHGDGSLITPANPAFRGETIVAYTTGLGPVSVNIRDGYAAPSNPLAYTLDPFQAEVAGAPCQVYFSGLAPGFVGLYQLNLVLPRNLPAGNLDFQIFTPYASSGVTRLPVF